MKISFRKSIPIKQSNPQRPPEAFWKDGEWHIRIDYPASSSLAGSYVILSADGAARQMTIDDSGNLMNEFNLNEGEKK